MFSSPFQESILGKAIQKGLIEIRIINIRDFAIDKHQVVDDTPYGGGQGMVMKVEPIARAIEWAKSEDPSAWTIYLTPQGSPFDQEKARDLSRRSHLILLCGRYEGVDERVRELFIDEEISIGDYVLTGGELAAMVVIDAVSRLLPGVLGSDQSAEEDSFTNSLLEYPQYTRPFDFRGRCRSGGSPFGKSCCDLSLEAKGGPQENIDQATGPFGEGPSHAKETEELLEEIRQGGDGI